MKTYFFIMLFFCSFYGQSFAAQDDTIAQMTQSHTALSSLTASQWNEIEKTQLQKISWKTKLAIKLAKKKIAKEERKFKKTRAGGGILGGLIALIVVGVVLIPFGILILLPLLIVGIILLSMGIVGAVLGGMGRIFW